jgi:hypothetical protein
MVSRNKTRDEKSTTKGGKTKLAPNFILILLDRRKEVKKILENNEEERFYESIIVQYSLIESTLKFLVFLQLTLNLTLLHLRKNTSAEDYSFKMDSLKKYCQNLSFYQALNLAISSNVIDEKLYKEIDKIRIERNDWIHQCWLLYYKSDPSELKESLKQVNDTFWSLTVSFGDLINDLKTRPELIVKLTNLNFFFGKNKKKIQEKKKRNSSTNTQIKPVKK